MTSPALLTADRTSSILRPIGAATSWLSRFIDGQCAVCHAWCRSRLCDECRSAFTTVVPRCTRCGIRFSGSMAECGECGECIVAPPAFKRTVAAVDYAYPWADLVGRFKFADSLDLADVLAGTMAKAVMAAPSPRPDLLLPVPLGAQRSRERGYNQSWELASRMSRLVGVRADATLLLRVRDTPAQSTLHPGDRASNLERAFAVEPARLADVRDLVVAVVDDVMTTGATGDEVSRTLLRAGAAEVHLWVLARTPKPMDLS